MEKIRIRESNAADHNAILSLYPLAFPDENLVPLVTDLLQAPEATMSLIALMGSKLAGHAMFTHCSVNGTGVALLGPVAVAPDRQGKGVGSAIIRLGLKKLEQAGVSTVLVLGDPAYYQRFGFLPDSIVEPPYPLPADWHGAWQSKTHGDTGVAAAGKLSVPPPWRRRELWVE